MRDKDSEQSTYFRSERFSLVNGAWYFQTREQSLGPFSNRELAEKALQNYLVELNALKKFEDSRRLARIIRVTDSRNKAKQPPEEPLIEVVEEYSVQRRGEEKTPEMAHLNKPNAPQSKIFTSSGSRLTLVPVDR